MGRIQIRFVTSNRLKIKEAREILQPAGVDVITAEIKIEELQTIDTQSLVRDKALKAFREISRPLFVEHTGLYLSYINELPGGLTQIVWDALKADKFSEIFGKTSDTNVIARTTVGYIDGRKIHFFEGELSGRISDIPRGNRDFQWDCVFVPNGFEETFAEMGKIKNTISMRKKALDKFAELLKQRGTN